MKRPSGESHPDEAELDQEASLALDQLRGRCVEAQARWHLWTPGETILLAVSGGPDSVALAHFFAREFSAGSLALAHFHHQLRGEEADADEEYVEGLARRLGLPFFSGTAPVMDLAQNAGDSLETAARNARYEFLLATAQREGFDRIATGHTATDRAETILFHLLRGCGLPGLTGIPPRRGRIIRPLLTATREETQAYCRACALHPREDSSNWDPATGTRNRLRLELLPLLRREYNPAVEEALLRLADAAGHELEWTRPHVEKTLAGLSREDESGLLLEIAALQELAPGLRLRVWQEAWVALAGSREELSSSALARLEELIGSCRTGSWVPLGAGYFARRDYDEIRLTPHSLSPAAKDDWENFRACFGAGDTMHLPAGSGKLQIREFMSRPTELGAPDLRRITIDPEAVELPLAVRAWRPGDRLQPLGLGGHKKLQDVFVDMKVPKRERGTIPVLVDAQDNPVWVVGCVRGERGKVTPSTRRFWTIWHLQNNVD